MKKIKKMLFSNYKYILGSFFIITIIGIFIGKTLNVIADMDSLSISSDAIVYIKDDHFNSGQAAAVTPTGKTIFIFFQQDGDDGTIGTHLTTLVILKRNSAGNYVEKARIKDLDCGHANGATYYKEGSDHYLLVATSAYPAENPATVVKYKMDLTNYKVLSQKKITLSNRINGIAWDNDKNRIIVAHMDSTSHSLVAYDTAFNKSEVIRKSEYIGASRRGGELGDFYNNQDIVYYNNKIYVVTAGSTKSANPCISFAKANGFDASTFCTDQETILDNYLTVIDANTGDFSKTLFIGGEKLGKLMKNNNYYDTERMREIEDILFIDGKMYIGVQKAGNYVITQVTSSDSVVYSYNKLYVNYKMNGGRLAPNHGSNITASSDTILFNGEPKVVNGYTGENLISGGFYDYNDPSAINIEKDGYHIEKGSEWKSSDNKVYSQSKEYRVYDFADTSIKDATVTLLANWKANNYTIVYNANGGSGGGMPVTKCVYDKSCSLSKNTFTRSGYKFVGWTLNKDGSGTAYGDQVTVTNLTKNNNYTVTLYAKWTPIKYYLKLNDNNGTSNVKNVTMTYDHSYDLSTYKPTRSGYTLTGWSTSSSATTPQYSPTQTISNLTTIEDKTISFYAVWSVNTYTVTFNSTGGSGVSSMTLEYGKPLGTLSTPTKTGYTFKGWFTESTGGTQISSSTTVKGNVTYYAQWTPIKYYLKLVNNDGTENTKIIQLEYGTSYSLSNYQPTRSGYTLTGWSTSSSSTTVQYNPTQLVTNLVSNTNQSVTLYAVWSVRNYTISFNSSGGSSVTSVKKKYGETLGALPIPTKTGYAFKGWYTQPSGGTRISSSVTVTGNATYYAQWDPISYTISFDANGGIGTMSSVSMKYGSSINLPANSFDRSGYIFNGWNTKSDGTGSDYSDQQQVSNLTTTANGNVTLYAKWIVNNGYKITYDLDGGTLSTNNLVNYDSTTPTFKLNNPSKEGYKFKGWTGSNGTTPQLEVTIAQGTTGNLNYKANYEAIKYVLKFKVGTEIKTLELEYGSTITGVPDPAKKGYTFLGWLDEDGEVLGETVGIGNKVYNPEYRPNKYIIKYDSNGGSGTMNDQVIEYDQKDAVSNNLFTKSNELFVEWNSKKDGTGIGYKSNDEIINLTDQDNEEIVLYAIWQLADLPDEGESHGLEDPKNDQDSSQGNTSENKKNNAVNPKTGASLSIGILVLLSIVGALVYKLSLKKSFFRKI